MTTINFRRRKLALAIASAALGSSVAAYAQDEASTAEQEGTQPVEQRRALVPSPPMEEIVVTTRLKDSATAIATERLEQPYSAEVLGVDQITRVGDSNIASALRRVTGLTLIDGKYIYVRGLGERYSSTTLNGAAVPSPELTRNVIPLDMFPTSILSSVKVYKAYSADQPAAFGGGNIDIRTRGVPDGPVFDISLGTGWNSQSSDDGLKTMGDGGDLPSPIKGAIQTYAGNISPGNITSYINTDGGTPSAAERAQGRAINRELMLSLDRDIEITDESLDPDMSGSIALGNSWMVNDDWVLGALVNLDAENQSRNEDQTERSFTSPDTSYDNIQKTVYEESFTGAVNFGVAYLDKHFINTNSYLLQIDEDQSSIVEGHNGDFLASDGRQRKTYVTRLEQRELLVNQITGEHRVEDDDFGFVRLPSFIPSVNLSWIYSDSKASTDVPNATAIQASNTLDPSTGALLNTQIDAGSSSQFNFLELEDDVVSGGFHLEVPFEFDGYYGAVSGGYLDTEKTRSYYGYTANIIASGTSPRTGTPGQVLSDANLSDPNNGFELALGSNFGTESYIAAETIEAAYGAFDVTFFETWRLSAGVRWEEFHRGLLPVDLLDFSGESIRDLIEDIQQPDQKFAIRDDDYYPSVALTYMRDGLLGAENFQLRFGYGKTVVRPDLREVSDIQFIDPELNIRVQGNPNLVFADVDHFDLRAELFYGDGSNFTASLFYKDIANPIESVERPGPTEARLLSFDNAESGEVYGIEFEGLKELGRGFFLTGNVVLSDSELTFAENSSQTSQKRRLTGHSKYVVNAQLGFDSEDGKHSLSTVYNVFGERIFFGGLNPSPDAYEQPFHSLDMVYSFYPTDNATIKLKVANLLGEDQTFEREGIDGSDVTIIERELGTSVGLDFKYSF